jgi:hypothetical protein
MIFKIRPYHDMTMDGSKSHGFFVQRKENKWYKWFWETVCIQRKGVISVMTFSTREKAQAWIDKQNISVVGR